ncbi:MAG: endonuclease/exonuclease/phosphatase family protein [Gemmatimonadetes bacterium]|nr:endonuclease/exonuclease/phosphatase family protein [Gemmatimonadota bacterium]
MFNRTFLRAGAAVAALLLAGLAGCTDRTQPLTPTPDQVTAADARSAFGLEKEAFTVYQQNAYLGGNTDPLFSIDLSDIPLLLATTNTFWGQVKDSHVPERMAALVDQIADRRPDFVTLEEVFQMAVVDATTGQVLDGADLLASIMGEIQRRGLPYVLVQAKPNTSVTLPMAVDFTTGTVTKVLMATDRIAVLRRTDMDVTAVTEGTYAADIPLAPGVTVTRGWIRVDTDRKGVPYHLVATHLETQTTRQVQALQTAELLNSVTAGLDGVTIIAGDLNSNAAGGPGDPSWTPTYQTLLDGGFTDAWVQAGGNPHDEGLTCCHADDLRDPWPAQFYQRIDFVLVRDVQNRSMSGKVSGSMRVEVLDTRQSDRTPEGQWLSDHAGVLAGLMLPKR